MFKLYITSQESIFKMEVNRNVIMVAPDGTQWGIGPDGNLVKVGRLPPVAFPCTAANLNEPEVFARVVRASNPLLRLRDKARVSWKRLRRATYQLYCDFRYWRPPMYISDDESSGDDSSGDDDLYC